MKILYVTTISNTIGFFISHINMLLDQGHSVDFACNLDRPLNEGLQNRGCHIFQINFSRSPTDRNNIKAYKEIKELILRGGYDIVHVHTPIAAAVTRLACKNIPNIKVIYTAHGFHFFKGAPLKNWLLYYPIEKYLSKYTDILITINQEDYKRAKKKFKAKQLEYVPGVGINIQKFNVALLDRVAKRLELGISENSFVMVSVGELNENKNHQIVIKALKKVNSPDIHYLICGVGPSKNKLTSLISRLGLESQVTLLGYREDIPEILHASDVFVFPSKREGLGLAAIEAMAVGLPIITSNIHGIMDYSVDGVTGFTCSSKSSEEFLVSILKILEDSDLRKKMGNYNMEVAKKYATLNILKAMDTIYRSNIKTF